MADLVEYEWDVQHSQKLLDEMHVPVHASELRVGFVFENDSVLQRCIHAMKYQGMYSIGFWFGRLLGERLVETSMIEDNPILIPVPLNKLKQYERGYNQSEWISKGIAFETELPLLTNGLVRTRYTKSQAQSKLHADERKNNVKDAFIVGANLKDQILKKVIILVDDLITTGATTGECIDELLIAGASEVRVVGLSMPQKKLI